MLVMLGLPLCDEFLLLQNYGSPRLPASLGGTFVWLPCYKAIADMQCYRRKISSNSYSSLSFSCLPATLISTCVL